MEKGSASDSAETFPTPVLEIAVVVLETNVRPERRKVVVGKRRHEIETRMTRVDCGQEDPSTPVPETSTVVPMCQRETEEMGGGSEEAWHEGIKNGGKEMSCEEAKVEAAVDLDEEVGGDKV